MRLRGGRRRTRGATTRSTWLLGARLGLSTVFALAGLMFVFSTAASAAVATPLVSTSTSDSGGSAVGNGTVLRVTFNGAPVLAASYSLTLTDGSHVATLSSAAGSLSATVNGTSIAFTVHGATNLSLSVLEILASTGVSDSSGNPWNLVASGQVNRSSSCSNIAGFTRVFRGSNCQTAGPIAPDVYDVIALPTTDLPGPPNDNAPEVITNCQAGSTDTVYDLTTGAALGSNPCGNNPNETAIGNTNSNTLDYISTPKLASFEQVGVIETIPASNYVSATSVPPQLSAITVNGNKATFTYYEKVVCQANSSDRPTISQFTYATPYTNLNRSGLVYASAISCPPSAGATSITVTWSGTIPRSGIRFKYEGYGQGHFIVGAPGTAFASERAASQSAYAGPSTNPGATISSFTPPSTTLAASSGGTVNASFATTNALSCSVSAVSLPAGAAALSLPSVASCNGTGAITVPANTSSTTSVTYTVTLTANGAAGTTPATAPITITVPAAPPPVPVNSSAPTITGNAVQGQTLTETHGSWSNSPTSYAFQWQDCDSTGTTCTPITSATGQTYTLTANDVGSTIEVQETATNIGGPGTPANSTPTALVTAPPVPVNSSAPTITGNAVQGQTLTETHGSWSNSPTGYTIKWQDCDSTGTTCTPILNASGQTYTLTSNDVGSTIVAQETATNIGGPSTPANSTPTALVTAPPVPPAITAISPASGPTAGGTTVTITGSGFTGATKVVFGSVPATSFSVVSATTITAVSPAQAASTYNIAVTTSGGTSATVSADAYTYQAPSGPPGTLLVSTSTSDSGGSTVGDGTVLTVNFNEVPVLAGSYSLTLTDGSRVATLSTAAGSLSAAVNGSSIAFTVHGATNLSLSVLEILGSAGVTDGSGNTWNLVASGKVNMANGCSNIAGFTRVFRGSNCQVAGPIAPSIFDVIALPTTDLPGPPNDNAPEVITNCQAGSTDAVYDLNTGAALGSNPCGNNPNEAAIGNTNSNTLDYISTPKLASFEQVGVIETIPGSSYVSATAVPVQVSAITVNGNQATFTYYEPVVCQGTSSDPATISQFTYVTPYNNLSHSSLVYASGIACPSSAGATSITVTWSGTIPVSSGVRFKYEGYGQGHFIVGAPGSLFAGERAASQSAYAGPSALGPH